MFLSTLIDLLMSHDHFMYVQSHLLFLKLKATHWRDVEQSDLGISRTNPL
ncbi:uncharacterized protein METZ01_LOCUS140915 [marine metagenome]|uniref:Uncharacterized protein n=1 Tax=marine metagenome TaxID=408172 RepID=A0A381ZGD9_9ZZZZ